MHVRNIILLLHQSKRNREPTLDFWIPPCATTPCGTIPCQTAPCGNILCATAAAPCEVVLVQVKVTGNASLIGNHHHRLPLIPPNNLL